MRASFVWLVLCVSLFNQPVLADDEEDLPALELLGFIADFSDEDEGWTDPESVENLFSPNGGDNKPATTGQYEVTTGDTATNDNNRRSETTTVEQ